MCFIWQIVVTRGVSGIRFLDHSTGDRSLDVLISASTQYNGDSVDLE